MQRSVFPLRQRRTQQSGNRSSAKAWRPPQFPLHPVEGRRYLVDAAGRPFLIVGDSAWSLLTQLTAEDAELYLADRQAKGFNTILVNLLEHKYADDAPRNVYGDGPFEKDGDFSTANDRYFDRVERVMRNATQKGFLILLAPAYTGADGGDEGWYREMEATGADRLRKFGRYVGQRFKDFNNIVWVHVGDYNPPNKKLSQAVAEGIRETLPNSLHVAHNGPGMHGLGYWSASEIPIAIDTLYTYAPVAEEAVPLAANQAMPYFLIESRYENERDGTPLRTRIQAWQAVLSGAAGQVFGNSPIWYFNAKVVDPQPMRWMTALNSPGALGISYLRDFLFSLPWFTLEPDSDRKVLVGGALDGQFQAVAARSDRRQVCDRLPAISSSVRRRHETICRRLCRRRAGLTQQRRILRTRTSNLNRRPGARNSTSQIAVATATGCCCFSHHGVGLGLRNFGVAGG